MTSHWNKVSPTSPHLVNVSRVDQRPVRVGVVRSVGFHWILTVGVSFKGSYSLVYGGRSSISSFVRIYGKVRFLQPSGLIVEDCKTVLLLGLCPLPIFHLRLFDLVVRGEWLLPTAVFKDLVGEAFAGDPVYSFAACPVHVSTSDSCRRRKKTISISFSVFLFCIGRVASSCISFASTGFLDIFLKKIMASV